MIPGCIILAGGQGTRLRPELGNLPKCLAPVAGVPFLDYLFRYLAGQGIQGAILALGYGQEQVQEWISGRNLPLKVDLSSESHPMGTGGAIRLALERIQDQEVFILNGDTFFPVNLQELYCFHLEKAGILTLALKWKYRFDRYGTVDLDEQGRILAFREKTYRDAGLINGGLYCGHRESLLAGLAPGVSSLEQDFLESHVGDGHFFGCVSPAYFIDIGVPLDYSRAQHELSDYAANHQGMDPFPGPGRGHQ